MATSHFFIGGGAEHTAEMVRRDSFAKMGGAEGIVRATDLQVLPYAVPGGGVRVTIGSAYIQSRYPASADQMYMGSVVTQETVAIPQNTGSGVRRDLIVMRLRDPYVQGSPWPDPGAGITNPEAAEVARATAKYVYVERIASVPANTTRLQDVAGYESDTAVTLARLDIPGATGTITSGMISHLRTVARPRRSEIMFARPRIASDDTAQRFLTGKLSEGGEIFPGGAGSPNEFKIPVPEWATRMVVDAQWIALYYQGGKDPIGEYWVEYGDEYRERTWPNKQQFEFATQHFVFNPPLTADYRTDTWSAADEMPVPAKLRGKTITVAFKAGLGNSPGPQAVYMNAMGGLKCYITFAEAAIGPDTI